MATVLPIFVPETLPPTKLPATNSRFCLACDMAPPLVALVACIIALSVALHIHSYYFCIPFGLGILGSCYALYSAYQVRDLTSLHQSALNLEAEVSRLSATNAALEHTNQRLDKNVTDLSEKVSDLEKANEDLKRTADSLRASSAAFEAQCAALQDQLTKLQDLKRHIETDLASAQLARDQHKQELDKTQQQLKEIETEFRDTLEALQKNLGSLEGLGLAGVAEGLKQTTLSSKELETSLKQRLEECATLARRLSGQTLQEILETQRLAQQNVAEQQRLLLETQITHSALNAEIPILKRERERIQAENTKFTESNLTLSNEVTRLQTDLDRLTQQISRLTQTTNEN